MEPSCAPQPPATSEFFPEGLKLKFRLAIPKVYIRLFHFMIPSNDWDLLISENVGKGVVAGALIPICRKGI